MNDRPPEPNFYITNENFTGLVGGGLWNINDIPPERWAQVKDHLGGVDTFAVFASGIPPQAATGIGGHIGGIDWVRLESSPKSGEPPLNVYHYGIGQPDDNGYPVFGPIRNGSIAPHWSELEGLDVYLGPNDPPDDLEE